MCGQLSLRQVSVSAHKVYYGSAVSSSRVQFFCSFSSITGHIFSALAAALLLHKPLTDTRFTSDFWFLCLFAAICSSETQLCRICPTALVQTHPARSPLSLTRTHTHQWVSHAFTGRPPSTEQHHYAALIRPHLLRHQRHIHERLCVCVQHLSVSLLCFGECLECVC